MKIRLLVLALALAAPYAHAQRHDRYDYEYAYDYAYDYAPSTGDATLDAVLEAINVLFADEPEYVVERIVYETQAPPVVVREYLVEHRYAPADVYMIGQLAQVSGRPFRDVAKRYDAGRVGARAGAASARTGGGWGKVARDLGIKPGSAEFHALKRGGGSIVERARGRGAAQDSRDPRYVAVPAARERGRGAVQERGARPGKGHGRGKDKNKDKDKDQGKGRGKGKD